MNRLFSILILMLATLPANAASEEDLLRVEQAFTFEAIADDNDIVVRWRAEPGYYLYKKRFGFKNLNDSVRLGAPVYTEGEIHEDQFFGKSEIYRGDFEVRIPYTRIPGSENTVDLELKLQGCADIGLCYPPQTWTASVALPVESETAAGANLLAAIKDGNDVTSGDFLPVDQAFSFTATPINNGWVELGWQIAVGYYLYRDHLGFVATGSGQTVGEPVLPDGKKNHDEYFGDVEVYYDELILRLPVQSMSGSLDLTVNYQGCAEDGICYPPTAKSVTLDLTTAGIAQSGLSGPGSSVAVSEEDRLAGLISRGSLAWVVAAFFGFGVLLAFTPCVLPMVPILSSILVGHGEKIGTGRALSLSLAYVIAMSLTYTVAGVAAALLGQNLQAAFQHPAILISFSAVFVVLSLSMFGLYELQIPASLQTRLTLSSQKQKGGTLLGAGIMGLLSALIVGPCVAAPLTAALIVIGQTGDAVRGGLALFALSLGMGAPLIAFGTSAGRLLPKAGPWMNAIKAGFGILLLGVAVWMLERIIAPAMTLALWAALLIGSGVFMGAMTSLGNNPPASRKLAKATGLLAVVYGVILLLGAASGGSDPLRPLAGGLLGGEQQPGLSFKRIKTTEDLDRELKLASADGRLAMLDFYADWCISCKEMERSTFHDQAVLNALDGAVLLQADVTANDSADQALLERFGIFGPPTIAFFDLQGFEMRGFRQVGYASADEFAELVNRANQAAGL
jgi:thiol:disulfide interchange protein DsbD